MFIWEMFVNGISLKVRPIFSQKVQFCSGLGQHFFLCASFYMVVKYFIILFSLFEFYFIYSNFIPFSLPPHPTS